MAKIKKPTTYRNLEVCQYIENAPHLATPDKVQKIIENHPFIEKYAFIYHTEDEKHPHIHIMMGFDNPKPLTQIANAFNVEPQYVEKIKSTFNKALAYLTHANTPDKHQYSTKDVYTNILEIDKITNRERKTDLNDVFDKIATGEVREYNIHRYITVNDYVDHEPKLRRAFNFYRKQNKDYNRRLKVVYIFGESGSGKTTLAKNLIELWGYDKDYYLSSGGKNMLDNYEGEPAILLDDFRDDKMEHSDFLKLLDPFTASMASARYSNKMIYCDLIIITCPMPMYAIYQFKNEERKQIMRRLPVCLELHAQDDSIEISVYDNGINDHIPEFNLKLTLDDIEGIGKIVQEKLEEYVSKKEQRK